MRHLGVVLAVAKDIRTITSKLGTITLKVRRIATVGQLRSLQDKGNNLVDNMVPAPLANIKEIFLLGDEAYMHYVLLLLVQPIDFELSIYYVFDSTVAENELLLLETPLEFDFLIRRIAYTKDQLLEVRPIWKQHPIRGEIEIEHFGRQTLIDRFFRRKDGILVKVVLMLNFTDAFSLYRNMYRALIGFYMLNSAFTIIERRRRTNIFLLTIGPYSSNLEGIVQAIGLFLI